MILDRREEFIQVLADALSHSIPNSDAVGIARVSLAFSIELQEYVSAGAVSRKNNIIRNQVSTISRLLKENKKLRYKSENSYIRAIRRLSNKASEIREELLEKKLIRKSNKAIEKELKKCSVDCLLKNYGDIE